MFERLKAAAVATITATTIAVTNGQTSPAPSASQPRAAEFLERLKLAVDSADRRAVSAMVAYPLTVLASGFNIPVKDAPTFVRMYDSVLTPELRCAVAASQIPTGNMPAPRHPAIITPDGLSMVEGAIWAPLKDGRYLIARVRVLPPAPSVEGRKGIERVTFAEPKGERSATFAGWLVRQNVDTYVVAMRKGETIQARIDGFRGHDATLRVSAGGCRAPRGRRLQCQTSVETPPRRRPPTGSTWSKWRISPGTAMDRNDINSPSPFGKDAMWRPAGRRTSPTETARSFHMLRHFYRVAVAFG